MITLGKNLKWPKTCGKRLYKKTRVVLCQKPLEKKTKYSRNETILKIGHLAKAIAHGKAIAFAKWSVAFAKWSLGGFSKSCHLANNICFLEPIFA